MMTKHDHLFKTLLTTIDYYGRVPSMEDTMSRCNRDYANASVDKDSRQRGSVFNNDSIETQNVNNIFVMFSCSLTLKYLKTMSHVGTLTRKAITYLFLQNGQDVRLTAGREFLQATTASTYKFTVGY